MTTGSSSSYSHHYYPHEGNSTLSTSVTIHVTPEQYHLKSWAILWSSFLLPILFAAVQIYYENVWFREAAASTTTQRKSGSGGRSGGGEKESASSESLGKESSSLLYSSGRPIRMVGGGRSRGHHGSSRILSNTDVEHGGGGISSGVSTRSDGEASVSSADWTRRKFRWLLLVAMMSRAVMIPIQIYMNPIWAQLVADTLPAMAFASVWTLLVSFFVKLVGVALGTGGSGDGSDATPIGVVIQCTAYVVYVMLMAMYFVNDVAAVLLYALLCCIYAALWGTSLYFCPRLLTLVYPTFLSMMNSTTETTRNIPNRGNGTNLRSTATSNSAGGENNSSHSSSSNNNTNSKLSALAIRLAVSGVLCVVVFGARTVGFCRKIVAPDHTASWWWQYGCLELFPSILFMLLIKPKCSGGGKNNAAKTSSQSPQSRQEPSDWHGAGGGRRTFSVSHVGRDGVKGADESIPLMKSMGGYGSGGSAGSGPPSPSSLR